MIKFSALNVVSYVKNAKWVIWDNGDNQEVIAFCKQLVENNPNKTLEILYYKSPKNVVGNAAKEVIKTYLDEDCKYILHFDEDILFAPYNFQSTLQEILDQEEIPIGYVACNVFQDLLTNGAKPSMTHYQKRRVANHDILIGPTGGWLSMTSVKTYQKVNGFPQNNKNPFISIDGLYSAALYNKGYKTAIAANCSCYHATGQKWNSYFGYDKLHRYKLDNFTKKD